MINCEAVKDFAVFLVGFFCFMMYRTLCFVAIFGLFFIKPIYAQVVDTLSSVQFGSFDFDTSYNAAIQLATNGNLGVVGSGIVSNGGEAVGHLRITSPDTGLVDIKCSSTAVLSDPTATDLTIDSIEIAVNTGVVFGNGNSCNGVGAGDSVAVTVDMDALPDPDIYIGGQIVINGAITLPTDQTYSTSGAGTPISFSVVVQ